MKKLISILLSIMLMFTCVACSRDNDQEHIDDNKVQLYIGNIEGGFGQKWLEKAKIAFEEKYANHEFENGKVGVQIRLSADQYYNGPSLPQVMLNAPCDIIFSESDYNYYSLVQKGFIEDITDAVTTPLTEFGEDKSIEDKMRENYRNWYKMDGVKYYGIPTVSSQYGFIYDIDLFEGKDIDGNVNEDAGLYFAKGGCPSEFSDFVQENNSDKTTGEFSDYIFTGTGEKSAGPDGIYGTVDDGLPSTYDEFFVLCDRMVNIGITPVTWTGANLLYIASLAISMWCDYEGEEQMYLNYSLNGKATDLVKNIDNGIVNTYEENINERNGYLMRQQAGKYYALSFMERLLKETNYYDSNLCFSSAQSNLLAQDEFLYSRFIPSKKPIAMLVDGNWWINEAEGTFNDMEDSFGVKASRENRHFGFLPFPKAYEEKIGEKNTFFDINISSVFVASTIEDYKLDIAKKFIRYCFTDEMMSEFTQTTGALRAYEYDLPEDIYNGLNQYSKQIYDISNKADWVNPASQSKPFKLDPAYFSTTTSLWSSTVLYNGKNETWTNFARAFAKYNINAQQYFEGLEVGESYWNSKFSSIY